MSISDKIAIASLIVTVITLGIAIYALFTWPPLHKGTKCDMRFKSSLNSARLNLLNPYK